MTKIKLYPSMTAMIMDSLRKDAERAENDDFRSTYVLALLEAKDARIAELEAELAEASQGWYSAIGVIAEFNVGASTYRCRALALRRQAQKIRQQNRLLPVALSEIYMARIRKLLQQKLQLDGRPERVEELEAQLAEAIRR